MKMSVLGWKVRLKRANFRVGILLCGRDVSFVTWAENRSTLDGDFIRFKRLWTPIEWFFPYSMLEKGECWDKEDACTDDDNSRERGSISYSEGFGEMDLVAVEKETKTLAHA